MNIALWFRYAALNLRSGLKGFWILLTCLTLGVAAMAIIGSLSSAIEQGLAEEGQPLMGGDVEFSLLQREATDKERAYIESLGATSRVVTMRAMATAGERTTLVEAKAVDEAYPLYGTVTVEGDVEPRLLFSDDAVPNVLVDPLLLGRLGVATGDTIRIGQQALRVAGVIATEPDRISDGIVLGPRLLMSHSAMAKTGLLQPGSLVTWRYRVKLPDGGGLAAGRRIVDAAAAKFPDAGWRVRATDNAAAGAERFVDRLGYFMTLVAIAALAIGGSGIANAVSAFIASRRTSIAALKCMGLRPRDVVGLYLAEIILAGAIGIALAILLGAAAPWILRTALGHIIPLPVAAGVQYGSLLVAALVGFLVLIGFACLPLARVARIRGSDLLRSQVVEARGPFAWPWLAAAIFILALAAGVVIWNSDQRWLTVEFIGGLAGSFAILAGLAYGLLALMGRLPRPRHILLRHALAELHRPGATALSVILALGLGLSLFVMLALTDATLTRELKAGIPDRAPAFFFLDVRNEELESFRTALKSEAGVGVIGNAPMLRGRIVEVKGVAADKVEPKPEAAWALRGDRGLTYSETLPQGSELVAGEWWPKDYAGPPLVSMVDEIADGIGVTVGDSIKVNVLGRVIEAKVGSLRRVNWRSLGINFVMVFTPNTLKAAPHSHIVTLEMNGGDESGLLNRMATAYPSVTAVRVKDALATVGDLLGKMLLAVRGANGLTLLTGFLVLAGALAAGLASRSYEAVVLKTYGATWAQLLTAFALEYGLLGSVAALFGLLTGTLGAWYLASAILEMPLAFSLPLALGTLAVALVITIGGGLIVTWRALVAKPAAYLRND